MIVDDLLIFFNNRKRHRFREKILARINFVEAALKQNREDIWIYNIITIIFALAYS
jgi:hypothetical protein